MKKLFLIVTCVIFLSGCAASSALRYPPSRWIKDNDMTPIAEPSERWRYSYAVGEFERYQLAVFEKVSSYIGVPKMVTGGKEEALNVNNFDEAPDSTWFTNRIGRFDMTPAQVARGSGTGKAPSVKDIFSVVWVGRAEVAPEIIVEDKNGDHYLLIFDDSRHPESATSATIVANRLLYAAGYNLPESHIVDVDRSKLVISPAAVTMTKYGDEVPATAEDLDRLLSMVAEDPKTETARAAMLAEEEGIPLGPFSFSGRRSDDKKNDRIPHEHRRELRGLATFCAFLDCTVMDDEQTGDFFVATGDDVGFITHYILHTDSTLGTYRKSEEQGQYNPAKWNPFFPNAAFANRTLRDTFWAAAILSRISNDAIAAAVGEAKYASKDKRDAIVKMLVDRKDKTIAYAFEKLSPLSNFNLLKDGGGLILDFDDLGKNNVYRYRLKTERERAILKDWTETSDTNASIEDDLVGRILKKRLYVLEIQAKKTDDKWWLPPVDVFLKRTGPDEITLMGIARRYR